MGKSLLISKKSHKIPQDPIKIRFKFHSYPIKITIRSHKIRFFPTKSCGFDAFFHAFEVPETGRVPATCATGDGHLRSPGGDLRGWGEESRGAGAAERGKLLAVSRKKNITWLHGVYIDICKRNKTKCMCMYACMHVCMYACMHACMYVWIYVCMHVWMYVGMYVWMYECMNVCMNVWMYVCMHECM